MLEWWARRPKSTGVGLGLPDRRLLNVIGTAVPAHLEIHVVLDNLSTHKTRRSSAGRCAIRTSRCTSRPPTAPG